MISILFPLCRLLFGFELTEIKFRQQLEFCIFQFHHYIQYVHLFNSMHCLHVQALKAPNVLSKNSTVRITVVVTYTCITIPMLMLYLIAPKNRFRQ